MDTLCCTRGPSKTQTIFDMFDEAIDKLKVNNVDLSKYEIKVSEKVYYEMVQRLPSCMTSSLITLNKWDYGDHIAEYKGIPICISKQVPETIVYLTKYID